MLSNLLIYRLIVLNASGAAFVGWACAEGYISILFAGEKTGIGYGIVALFLVGLVGLAQRAWKASRALNKLKFKQFGYSDDLIKFRIKNAYLGDVAVWLVTLGIIGTAVGLIIAISGLALSGSNPTESINHVVSGMKTALLNSVMGMSLGLWSEVNFRILSTATELLIKDSQK